jgi:signal transduction histidine kinase
MGLQRSDRQEFDAPPREGGTLDQFWWTPRRACIVSGAMAVSFFVADVILPRGATVAIGYCVVPAVAAAARRPRFLLAMTIVCTLLTWAALFLEPAGYAVWKSIFDRVMVTGVLWFALALVLRRAAVIGELVRQQRALSDATRELERSNRELYAFASVVAHDLRGPLNSLGLFAQLVASSSSIRDDLECTQSLGLMRAELNRMSDFIQSLLAYARVGSGTVRRQVCDCAAVLDHVRTDLSADIERSGARLLGDPLPVIRADPVLIAELLQNLIENAIKYCGDAPPRIHVSAAPCPEGWLFSVADNGPGIPPRDVDRIFQPFCQSDAGKALGKGVGLGLATCKRIVERHGGRIHAQSQPGAGTTFFFTIAPDPIAPDTAAHLPASSAAVDCAVPSARTA